MSGRHLLEPSDSTLERFVEVLQNQKETDETRQRLDKNVDSSLPVDSDHHESVLSSSSNQSNIAREGSSKTGFSAADVIRLLSIALEEEEEVEENELKEFRAHISNLLRHRVQKKKVKPHRVIEA